MPVVFIGIIVLNLSVFAEVKTQDLSSKVIELRKEVEILNDEYKTEREKILSDLKSLSLQKAELSSNIRNEEIRRKQLNDKVAKIKKQMGDSSVETKELEPVIAENLAQLKQWIETSLPFKTQERLSSLKALKDRIDKKEISTIKAANHLFSLMEDEKRLARETSLHRQSLMVDGKMQLAEVVKLGMLSLYFKTESGKIGMAVKTDQGWTYQSFSDQAKQNQTLVFFDSLKKQIRQGAFELPTTI